MHSTSFLCRTDGAVVVGGSILSVTVPCSWDTTPEHQQAACTDGQSPAADLLRRLVAGSFKREQEIVVAQFAEESSWLDPVRSLATVYTKADQPRAKVPTIPRPLLRGGEQVIQLPNVGREQHSFIYHIVHNYDNLAEHTSFFQAAAPSCGYFRVDPHKLGQHMLANVSAADYITARGDHFLPFTTRVDGNLSMFSIRSGFADNQTPRPVLPRPVTQMPPADGAGHDRWLPWEANDFGQFIWEQASIDHEGAMIPFADVFRRVVGRELPSVLYFGQGGQFSASAAALRRTPRETYAWLANLLEEGHVEVGFYVELMWPYMLAERPEVAETLPDRRELHPFLEHLGRGRRHLGTPYAPNVGLQGDPHLNFAHGGRADFRGTDGGVYNILSHAHLALNGGITFTKFKNWNLLISGSFFTEIFFVAQSAVSKTLIRFEFAPNAPPAMLHLPSASRPLKAGEKYDFEDISIKLEHTGGEVGASRRKTVSVTTSAWRIQATARPIARALEAGTFQIDIDLKPVGDPLAGVVSPHGLLGQSWDDDSVAVNGKMDHLSEMKRTATKSSDPKKENTFFEVETSAQAEGAIEGEGNDYLVTEPFSTKFKYSRFDGAPAKPRDISQLSGLKKEMGAKASQAAGTTGDDTVFEEGPTMATH